jgi:hypothetical protein
MEDKLIVATKVEEASTHALEEQHRAISEYISAQTSLDAVTKHHEVANDNFNMRLLAASLSSSSNPPQPQASVNQRVKRVLARLGELDDLVDAYKHRVNTALGQFSLPNSGQPIGRFPLKTLVQEAHSIKDELDIVDLKYPAVVALKVSISGKIQVALAQITQKERLWKEAVATAQEQVAVAAAHSVRYSSGALFNWLDWLAY